MTESSSGPPEPPREWGFYTRLLRLLPRSLREDYGEEMVFIISRRIADTPSRLGRCRVRIRAVADLLSHGGVEWCRWIIGRTPGGRRPSNDPGSPRVGEKKHRRRWWETIRQDLAYALRTLRRSPAYVVVVVVTLGVAISMNTLAFSLMNPFLFRPLPYTESEDLLHLGGVDSRGGWDGGRFSSPQIADLRERSRAFEDLAGYYYGTVNLSGNGPAERITTTWVTGNLFSLLGVKAHRGRVLDRDDDRPGGPKVVALGHDLWTRRYGSDPELVGRSIRLDGVLHRVVGILPERFNFPFNAVQLWIPMRADPVRADRSHMGTLVLGRLKEGWTRSSAQEEVTAIQQRLAASFPDADGRYTAIALKPMREALNFVWETLERASVILLVGMGFVLMIACVNVASLTLARLGARTREVALRKAMGAGRWRLVRQFLVEALVLAAFGGGVAVGLSHVGNILLSGTIPPDLYRVGEVSLDWRVLAFCAVVTLASPIFFAVLPAWAASRRDPSWGLKEGSAGGGVGRAAMRRRKGLVVVEVALGVVLVAGTGLMMRSLDNALNTDLGFSADEILTVEISLPETSAESESEREARLRRLNEGLTALPEVRLAGSVSHLPLNHEILTVPYAASGAPQIPAEDRPSAQTSWVGPGYFEAMEIPVLAGETFTSRDGTRQATEVVVSRALAGRLWPGESAVGQILAYGGTEEPTPATVIGVVGDVYFADLTTGPRPHLYRPLVGAGFRRRFFVLSSTSARSPEALVEPVRQALFQMEPDLPADLRPMAEIVKESTGLWALSSLFLGMFGLVALGLAALGIYGVVAFSVSRRRREMGLRLALGAHPRRIMGKVVGEGLRLTVVGMLLGGAGAVGCGALLSTWLLGVGPVDPATLSAVMAVFLVVAALSALAPARRAGRLEPADTLRGE